MKTALAALSLAAMPMAATAQMPGDGTTYAVGDLVISTPFARATMPNAPVAGGFMSITNTGEADDRLIAVASEAAGRMEIHEMAMDGDVMKMRQLEDGLTIPAGDTVSLQPGGYHVMFMDLAGPLVDGESVAVTLGFETAGAVKVVMPIVRLTGRMGGHGKAGN